MTAASYTTDLIAISTAETTTDWAEMTGHSSGGAPTQEGDYYIQGSFCVSQSTGTKTSTQCGLMYDYTSDVTISAGECVFMWQIFLAGNAVDTFTNGGYRLMIGSGTGDFEFWKTGGSDFGRNPYGGWVNVAVDPTYTPDYTEGTPAGTYRYFGSLPNIVSSVSKGNPHGVDSIKKGRGELKIEYGELTLGYGTFPGINAQNDSSTNRWGLFKAEGTGYLWKGLMSFGNVTNACDFRDSNASITIDSTPRTYAAFNKIEINNASSRVDWDGVNFAALDARQLSPGNFEVVDNADVNFDNCSFTDMNTLIFGSGSTINTSTFRRTGQTTQGGGVFDGCQFDDTDAPISLYTSNLDNVDNCDFTKGSPELDYYLESNQDTTTNMYSGSTIEYAQSFNGQATHAHKVKFYLSKTGSPTGNATAYLYAHTGTFGTSSTPTGAALATSATLDVSTLTTTLALTEFTFSTPYLMSSGTDYCVAIAYSGGGASDYITIGTDTSTPSHDGNASSYVSSWSASSTTDTAFYLYGTNHAIELTTAHAGNSYTLTNCTYTSYAGTDGSTGNECIYNNSAGAVTINVSGGDTPTIRNGTSASTTVVTSVAVTITIKDQSGIAIPGAEVAIFQDNAARTVVQASTATDGSGQLSTSAALNLGAIIIRVRQSTEIASFDTSLVNTSTEVITTTANHNFRDGDAVVYDKDGGSDAIGLTDSNTYYVNNLTATTLSLHPSAADAIANTNVEDITSTGTETHLLDPVRYVANSATGTIGSTAFSAQITMVTDSIATG